jgi:hypothetical protein
MKTVQEACCSGERSAFYRIGEIKTRFTKEGGSVPITVKFVPFNESRWPSAASLAPILVCQNSRLRMTTGSAPASAAATPAEVRQPTHPQA